MKVGIDVPSHGGQLHRIAELYGVPVSGLLDFSANINPEGPPASVMAALRDALSHPTVLSQYPDLEERQLKRSIAACSGIAPETILVANGFVPLLDAILRTLPIRRCLLPVPAFGEYRSTLERANVVVTPHVLDQDANFHYQLDDLLMALTVGCHDAILLANPQNPSGVLCERIDLIAFIEEAAKRHVFVLLDEAFVDYAPMHTVVGEIEQFPNLIVFRSVTKFNGCPGLRVAYAAANSTVTRIVQQNLPPWPITTLAAIAVSAMLSDAVYEKRTLLMNEERRERLITEIEMIGLHTYPSAANFLLIRFPSTAEAQTCWNQLICQHGIVLRHCTNFEGLSHDHLRCAVLADEQNSYLAKALDRLRVRYNLIT